MFGVLVLSHGNFASELVNAATKIMGPIDGLEGLSIGWNDDVAEATRMIQEAVERVDRGRGVLLMTDMFGGTPTNLALSLLEEGKVEIVTGANLPMLIKCTNLRGDVDLHEASVRVAKEGRRSIQVATKLLESEQGAEHDEPS